jgi:hypothetical protein
MLTIHGDCSAAGELAQRETMPLAFELQVHTVMHQALATQPLSHAYRAQQVDSALLQHAGAEPALYVLTIAAFDDDGLDAVAVQDLSKR